ncbi:MAG: 16S rRNA (adenine(1518)-N(6)/adenine(1519)-N(6))-dimethyltransferase RsmA [Clostridium sp.]|nr:16S rRNA (adenine(1518)-N(6)/adenine(1519)-N(6))-dimethyltransferase RsmA [Clostridium sp.]
MAENLAIPKNTIEIIQKHNFVFRKQFGQNFLIDPRVLDRIVEASGVGPEDCVLEIGPGIGTMTRKLAECAAKVIAVEIDDNLIPILRETLADLPNAEIIHNDIMKVDIRKLCEEENGGRPIHVVANLPYYITTPIIMGLFESGVPLKNVTVMVQKEVADRMQAGPGTKDYGALSLAVQYYSKAEIVANVPANCFMPRPKVGSAVIRLARYAEPPVAVKDPALMFRVIRAAFGQRRKTLVNALAGAPDLGLSKQQAQDAVGAAGFPANIRGEALTLEDFAKLADAAGMSLNDEKGGTCCMEGQE